MEIRRDGEVERTTLEILGRSYKVRSDEEPEHLEAVAHFVDEVLTEVRRATPDTQDAAVLGLLNVASELLRTRSQVSLPRERVQALIDLIDTA